jgi:hypothetical protein
VVPSGIRKVEDGGASGGVVVDEFEDSDESERVEGNRVALALKKLLDTDANASSSSIKDKVVREKVDQFPNSDDEFFRSSQRKLSTNTTKIIHSSIRSIVSILSFAVLISSRRNLQKLLQLSQRNADFLNHSKESQMSANPFLQRKRHPRLCISQSPLICRFHKILSHPV